MEWVKGAVEAMREVQQNQAQPQTNAPSAKESQSALSTVSSSGSGKEKEPRSPSGFSKVKNVVRHITGRSPSTEPEEVSPPTSPRSPSTKKEDGGSSSLAGSVASLNNQDGGGSSTPQQASTASTTNNVHGTATSTNANTQIFTHATRRVLYTANAGDARAVLSRAGRAVRLTYDHKGSDANEARRIKEAGGFVMNNRVNGVLAVTRSLGDTAMKAFVVGSPYTTETQLGEEDDLLIIACDGVSTFFLSFFSFLFFSFSLVGCSGYLRTL